MTKAIQLTKDDDGNVFASVAELTETELPEGDVTVDIDYSTLNYKDGLVLNGLGGLVKNYPHVPGVDFAGTVKHSSHPDFAVGDSIVSTGWRVGEVHWGGYAQQARVNGDWLIALPQGMTTRQAMIFGTAGFTAVQGVMALEEAGLDKNDGPVLVTGAAGGVGSVAVSALAKAGYTVEASTGRESTHDYLKSLGASAIVPRSELDTPNGRPLNKERWAGCIDSVGGSTLANVLTQMKYGASVAAIGLAGGSALETTVIPFLLRGVNLLGIDSVMCPTPKREAVWQRIASDLVDDQLDTIATEVALNEVIELGAGILKGEVQGRIVVNVNA